ncbi:MAG: T9SS type A sorting domain-containing protein, partial [Bacteroidota bacterium]
QDAPFASDHLPIVADFSLSGVSSSNHSPSKNHGSILEISPNPASQEALIQIDLVQAGLVEIHLLNTVGQEIKTIATQVVSPGEHLIKLDTSPFPSGGYFIRIKTVQAIQTKKLIIHH